MVAARRLAVTIAQTFDDTLVSEPSTNHNIKIHMMYNTPSVFCLMSSTPSGSCPPARALERMVSRDSFGMVLRRLWLSVTALVAVVIWLIILSSETDPSPGAMVTSWLY